MKQFYTIILTLVVGLAMTFTSCKKEEKLVVSSSTPASTIINKNNTEVTDLYIQTHVFIMVKRPGDGHTIKIWELQDLEGKVKIIINNLDSRIYWKYDVGDEVPSSLIIQLLKPVTTNSK